MTLLERLAVVLVGSAVAWSVYVGGRAAGTPDPDATRAPRPNPHGIMMEAGVAARSGIDPLRPPGLPAGASIDPETGLIVGIFLQPAPGEEALAWPTLGAVNDLPEGAAVPEAIEALDGRRVLMAGFLMPLYALTNIREFALVGSHYTCCFARPPGLGDQIIVKLRPGAAGLELMVKPLRVSGTLHLRPQHLYESGEGPLISLFEIHDAEAALLD